MTTANVIRKQIEQALSSKIPSALTPIARTIWPVTSTGIEQLDELLHGGIPVGAVTELVGAECTGRTSVAMSVLAKLTQANMVCAWIDATNSLDPASAASCGLDLERLLWIRCGGRRLERPSADNAFRGPAKYFVPQTPKKGLNGGGFGPHPRMESLGLSDAIPTLFGAATTVETAPAPRIAPSEPRSVDRQDAAPETKPFRRAQRGEHYDAIERALRSTDLVIQAGGFGAIVLDLAGLAPEYVARIELSTWHRYRVAAEKNQSCILLLTQYPCAKSGSELQLRLQPAEPILDEVTVFSGIRPRLDVARQRFARPLGNVIPMRKPPQSVSWSSRAPWAGAQ